MIKNDVWIESMAQRGMIIPYESKLIGKAYLPTSTKIISYGLSSFGYDIRLSGTLENLLTLVAV